MTNLIAKLSLDVSAVQQQLDKVKGTVKDLTVKLDVDTKGAENSLNGFETSAKSKFQGLKDSLSGAFDLSSIANFSAGGLIAGGIQSAISSVGTLVSSIKEIGSEYETNLKAVQAVTGSTDELMNKLSDSAKNLAEKFGGDASNQLKSFQGVLSRFGAQLAESPKDLETVANSINLLGKAGGIDAATAMDSLTNSMLQFGVDTSNSTELAAESSRFINVLAASAKVGAAEIPQVADAILQAGVAAKGANLSFEETNAAIQTLAVGGKVGSEAGVALRNVISLLQKQSGEGEKTLAKMGLTTQSLGNDLQKGGLNLALGNLKKGIESLGDPVAKNQALMQLFGAESAGAAGILLKGQENLAEWTKQMTGTNEATIQAKTNMSTFAEQMSRFQAFLSNIAINIFSAFNKGAGGFLEPIIGAFKDLVKIISDGLGSINFGGIFDAIKVILTPTILQLIVLWEVFKEALNVGFSFLSAVFNKIGEIFKPIVDQFKGIEGAGGGFLNVLKGILSFVGDVLITQFEILVDVIAIPFKIGGEVVGFLIGFLKDLYSTITESTAFQFLVDVFESVRNQIDVIVDSPFVNWVKDLFKEVQNLVNSALKGLVDTLVNIAGFIAGVFQTALKGLISIFNSIYGVVKSFISVLSDVSSSPVIGSFINPLIEGLKSIGGLIGGLIDSVLKFFGLIGEKKQVKVEQKVEQKVESKADTKVEPKVEAKTETKKTETKKENNTFLKESQDLAKKELQLTGETEKNKAKLREQYLKQSIKELDAEISQDRELTYSIASPSENTTLAFLEANLKTMQNRLDAQKLELGTKLEAQDTILSINLKLIDNEFQQKLADIENKYNAVRTDIENKIIQVKTSTTLTNTQKETLTKELNDQLTVEYKNYEDQVLIIKGEKLEKEQQAVETNAKKKKDIEDKYLGKTLESIDKTEQEIKKIKDKELDEDKKRKEKLLEEQKKFNEQIATEIAQSLTNIPATIQAKLDLDKQDLEKQKDDIKKQIDDLKKTDSTKPDSKKPKSGVDNRDIYEKGASDEISKLEDLEKKLRELEEKPVDWDKIIRGTLDETLKGVSKTLDKSFDNILKQSLDSQKAINDGNVSIGDSFTLLSEASGVALTQMGIAMADAVVTQQNVGKALLTSLLDTVQKVVNLVLVEILVKEVAAKSWLGVASYAGLAAIINVALAAAKSGIGAETGVIGISESYNKKAGVTDTIPIRVAKGESIITKDKTEKYKDVLTRIHNGTYTESFGVNLKNVTYKENFIDFEQKKVSQKVEVNKIEIDYNKLAEKIKLETNFYDRRKITVENRSNSIIKVAR